MAKVILVAIWLLVAPTGAMAKECYSFVYLNNYSGQYIRSPEAMEGVGKLIGREKRYCEQYEYQEKVILKPERELPDEYRDIILRASNETDVDKALIEAVIEVESAFRRDAVSIKGAKGLMQLMPFTAIRYGVEDPFDPEENIEGGAKYLADLLKRYGDVRSAIAAYNAGEKAVDEYQGVPPYRETQNYVDRVMAIYQTKKIAVNYVR